MFNCLLSNTIISKKIGSTYFVPDGIFGQMSLKGLNRTMIQSFVLDSSLPQVLTIPPTKRGMSEGQPVATARDRLLSRDS